MKKDLMFELSVNDSLKIRVYEDKNYDTLIEDCHIYLIDNEKEKKLLQHSFVYEFGLQMFQRLYNIYDYEDKVEIDKYLEDILNIDHTIEDFDAYIQSEQCAIDSYNYDKYVFVHCSHHYILLLYKRNEKYIFSIVKNSQHKIKRTYKSKLLCTYELSKEQIIDWREKVTKEFSIRKRKEFERVYGKISNHSWNKIIDSFKDEKKFYWEL